MTLAILCHGCRDEYAAWYHFDPPVSMRRMYTVTDKPADMLKLNHERWARVIREQQRIITQHCLNGHQRPGDAT